MKISRHVPAWVLLIFMFFCFCNITVFAAESGTDTAYKHGIISITAADADSEGVISLTVDQTAKITISPYIHVQYEGCGMGHCPHNCGEECFIYGKGCSCTAELDPAVRTAEVTVNSSNEAVIKSGGVTADEVDKTVFGNKADGVLTLTAVGEGEAVVTVTASLTDWVSTEATFTVKVTASKTEIPPAPALKTPVLSGVSNAASGITVKWEAVSGAAKYRVFRKISGGSWKNIADTTSTSYTDKSADLASGTTYIYTVRCISSDGKSYTSSYNSKGLSIVRLTNPSVTVTNAASGVTVKWGKVSGAKGYYVYRKTGSGSYSKIKTITSGSTVSYTDTAVKSKSGTTYTYTVRAYNGSTLSAYTGKSILRLENPSVTVTNVTSGVTVKWGKVSGAKGYYVYRKTGSGSYSKIKTITSSSTVSYTDTAVKSKNGTKYTYTVRAYNGSTLSSYAGKTAVRLTTPSISSATNSASKKMTVKWGKNSSATGYQIKYVTGSTTKTVTVKGASSVSKVISGLTKGKTYKVYVRSYKTVSSSNYYSAWSSAKSVKISR